MTTGLNHSRKIKSKLVKWLVRLFVVLATLVAVGFIAFKVSPWPSVLLIRYTFQKHGRATNEKLTPRTPQGIASMIDIQYDLSSSKTKLDIYSPVEAGNRAKKYPLITWVHGGGFVAGDKSELANYCKILASKGYIVAAVNYSRAPAVHYPVPVKQVNTALAFLVGKAVDFNIDTTKIIVAGDSGGAHITAQLANCYTDSAYAGMLSITPSVNPANLVAVILHCGPYNTDLSNLSGEYAGFLRTVLWSYIGNKDFEKNAKFPHFSVAKFVTEKFPKTFISVGNDDPLRLHSYDLAARLASKSVDVDSLFFPAEYLPALQHEYQFDLDTEAGRLALDRTFQFLSNCIADTIKSNQKEIISSARSGSD